MKWDYERDYVPRYGYERATDTYTDPTSEVLKRRGENGWELCAIEGPDSGGTRVFYFKRFGQEARK